MGTFGIIATVWILAVSGYIGVDGKEFGTLEDCRKFAFERIIALGQQNENIVWQCIERESRADNGPKELRPRYLRD